MDLRSGEHLGEAFRAINPDATVPVLVLKSGAKITDAVAICQYLEDIQPDPPLLGVGAEERALVTASQRWTEREGFYAVMEAFRNATPGLKNRALSGPVDYAQIPELAQRGRSRVQVFFGMLDKRLAEHEFVAGPTYSIADTTAFIAIDWAKRIKLTPSPEYENLSRWHAAVSARPSAAV